MLAVSRSARPEFAQGRATPGDGHGTARRAGTVMPPAPHRRDDTPSLRGCAHSAAERHVEPLSTECPPCRQPGTGFPGDTGAGDARGMSVNVALPGGTGDAGWLRAFTAVVPPLLRAFEPQVLVTQFGCDGHRLDIMSDLELSVDGMRRAYRILHELAHEVAAGRWLVLGGGGYESIRVVPRAWCHVLSEVVGVRLG